MIKLNNVSCSYNGKNVVHNISMEINDGEFFTIVGPNGSGKSTLVKAIGNLVAYTGAITINNIDISTLKPIELARKVAMLSQLSPTSFSFTVYETVMMGRYPFSTGLFAHNEDDHQIVMDSLQKTNMLSQKDTEIGSLSGGQLQRVFLARCFAQNPYIILLDEPTNHLDLTNQIEILDNVKCWAKAENKLIIAVIHDLNLVNKYSERTLLLNNGHSKYQDKTPTVLASSEINETYDIDIKKWMTDCYQLWTK